ncbi:MAG TPA: CrcB family protein [Capillimicrobium sp.]
MTLALVAAGGLLGTLARYGLGVWFPSLWTVVAINLAGSFALGLLTHVGTGWSPEIRTALSVGVLGGFTTFSTFTVQTVLEADGGRTGRAAAYLALSVVGGLLAAIAGYIVGRVATG